MPRLGSNFFDSYNNQIDTLRRRRKENMDAFNSYVKMRSEMGEKPTAKDLEKFKMTLGGGDNYFSSALPSSDAIRETVTRLGEIQADKRVQESTRAVNLDDKELSFVRNIVGGLVDVEANDKKIAEAFNTAGRSDLFEQYAPMIPNIHAEARNQAVTSWKGSVGFDEKETKEGVEVAMSSAPAWAKSQLQEQGNSQIAKANIAKVQQAKATIAQNMKSLVEDSNGDEKLLKEAVKSQITNLLGPLATPDVISQITNDALSQMKLDRSGKAAEALGGVTADNESLIAAQGNEAELKRLAIESLTKQGYTNPDETTIAAAMQTLRTQQSVALKQKFNQQISEAITKVGQLSEKELSVLDNDGEYSDKADDILISVFGNQYNNMTEDEKAQARARILPLIKSRAAGINEYELEEDTEAVNALIKEDAVLKNITSGGATAEVMTQIYARINLLRKSKGLPGLSDEQMQKQYGVTIEGMLYGGASENFYKRSKAITDEVGDVIEGLKTNQTKRVSEMFSKYGENSQWGFIAQTISERYFIINESGYSQLDDTIARLSQEDPPKTPQEQIDLANRVAVGLGFLPRADARKIIIAKKMADENLILPGTSPNEYVVGHSVLLGTGIKKGVAKIELMPIDADVEAIKGQLLEEIKGWEEAMKANLNDPAIKYLLGKEGMQEAIIAIQNKADEQRSALIQVQPAGKPTFMISSGGNYMVMDTGPLADKARASGYEPGAMYRKEADGSYTKIMNAPTVVPGSNATTSSNLPTSPLIQVDPDSTPFMQDMQEIMRNSDINSGPSRVASKISSGGFANLPASAPLFRSSVYQYFFGSNQPDVQQRRELGRRLAEFYRSPEALAYSRANPDKFQLMFADPLTWAAGAGFQP